MGKKSVLVIISGVLSCIFLFTFFSTDIAFAEKTISDDLYVTYPKSNIKFALDISQSPGDNYLSLITYQVHGRGNQLMGYEYRPEKDGYIIYSASQNQQIIGSTTVNTAKVTTYSQPINNMTEFSDEFIWDLKKGSDGYFTIANRKTKTYLTSTSPGNDKLITLASATNTDTQKFQLQTMNGVYQIRSNSVKSMGWDIEGGVGADRDVIAYPLGTLQSNQQWLILFKPNNNSYVISNYQQRNLLVTQPDLTSAPKVIQNNIPYETVYSNNNMFYFNSLGTTTDSKSIFAIKNSAMGDSYSYGKDSQYLTTSRLSMMKYSLPTPTSQQWIFDKVADIPKPEIKNVQISGTISGKSQTYFVGETLNLSGDFLGKGFSAYDLYSKFDVNDPVLSQQGVKINSDGTSTFKTTIDTVDYKEGNFFIEVFARADSMFQSNRLANKYKLIYPTPTGEAVPQSIEQGVALDQLDPAQFVTDLKDEIGSKIVAEKIEGIDTSVIGSQTAKVRIKNKYKTTTIDVPVTIVPKVIMSWSTTDAIKTKDETIDKSTLEDNLTETVYWKSISPKEQYRLTIKKGDTVISTKNTKLSGDNNQWVEENIDIPKNTLNYGVNELTVTIYPLDGVEIPLDKLKITINLNGSLKLESIPSQLSWTNLNSRQTKGILPRDKGNSMMLSVIDTRNLAEDKKTWSLRATTTIIDSAPFDLVWKDKDTDSGKSLVTEQVVLTKNTATKVNDTYQKTWSEASGILLSTNTYLKVGDYSGKVIVNWNLYDTMSPE